MANTLLGSKSVGDIVKLKVNGAAKNFIIVHQGLPSSAYDSSCNGTWVQMQDIYEKMAMNSGGYFTGFNYSDSMPYEYLTNSFLNLFEENIRNVIKEARIPCYNTKLSRVSNVSAKVFLLSLTEVGWTEFSSSPVEGAVLNYYKDAANSKRIANFNESADLWGLRTCSSNGSAFVVYAYGGCSGADGDDARGLRPALILPSTLYVNGNGEIITNTAPTITNTSGSSGVNLGTKTESFDFSYTVADADGDNLTVTEKLNGVTKKTFSTTGGTYTFEAVNAENFYKVLNGSHTLTVTVSDGTDTTTFTATFTKSVTSASITLETPITIEGDITAAVMSVVGDIPGDAEYKAEVTNNANDSIPVWQDVTNEVKLGQNIIFENTTTGNGAAFNFRVTVKRGSSNTGGYITAVTGAFQ